MNKFTLLIFLVTPALTAMDALEVPVPREQLSSKECVRSFLSYWELPPESNEELTTATPRNFINKDFIMQPSYHMTDETKKVWEQHKNTCARAAAFCEPIALAFMEKNLAELPQVKVCVDERLLEVEIALNANEVHRALHLLVDLVSELLNEHLSSQKLKKLPLQAVLTAHRSLLLPTFGNAQLNTRIPMYNNIHKVITNLKNACKKQVNPHISTSGIEFYQALWNGHTLKEPFDKAREQLGIFKVCIGLLAKAEVILRNMVTTRAQEFEDAKKALFSNYQDLELNKLSAEDLLTHSSNFICLHPGLPPTKLFKVFFDAFCKSLFFVANTTSVEVKNNLWEKAFHYGKLYCCLHGETLASNELFCITKELLALPDEGSKYFTERATHALIHEVSLVPLNEILKKAQEYANLAAAEPHFPIKFLYYLAAIHLGKKAPDNVETLEWLAKIYFTAAQYAPSLAAKKNLYLQAAQTINHCIALQKWDTDKAAGLRFKTATAINLWLATGKYHLDTDKKQPPSSFFNFIKDAHALFSPKPLSTYLGQPQQYLISNEEQKIRQQTLKCAVEQVKKMIEALGGDTRPDHFELALTVTAHALQNSTDPVEQEELVQQRADYLSIIMKLPKYSPSTEELEEAFHRTDEMISLTKSQKLKGILLSLAAWFREKGVPQTLEAHLAALKDILDLVKRHSEQQHVPFPTIVRKDIYTKALAVSSAARSILEQSPTPQKIFSLQKALSGAFADRAFLYTPFHTYASLGSLYYQAAFLCRTPRLIRKLLCKGAHHYQQAFTFYPEYAWPDKELYLLLGHTYKFLTTISTSNEHSHQAELFLAEAQELASAAEFIGKQEELVPYSGLGIPSFLTHIMQKKRKELEAFTSSVAEQLQRCLALQIGKRGILKNDSSDAFDTSTVEEIELVIRDASLGENQQPSEKVNPIDRAYAMKDDPEQEARLLKHFLRYATDLPPSQRLFLRKQGILVLNSLSQSCQIQWESYHDDFMVLLLLNNPVAMVIAQQTRKTIPHKGPDSAESKLLFTPFLEKYQLPRDIFLKKPSISEAFQEVTNKLSGEQQQKMKVLLWRHKSPSCLTPINGMHDDIQELEDANVQDIESLFALASLYHKRCATAVERGTLPILNDHLITYQTYQKVIAHEKKETGPTAQQLVRTAHQHSSDLLIELIDVSGDDALHVQAKDFASKDNLFHGAYTALKNELTIQEERLAQLLDDPVFEEIDAIDAQLTGTQQVAVTKRLLSDREELESSKVVQEVMHLRKRMRMICKEAVRLYNLGQNVAHKEPLTIAEELKRQAFGLKGEQNAGKHAQGAISFAAEKIYATHQSAQRCLLLYQATLFYTEWLKMLETYTSMNQFTDVLTICQKASKLARQACLPEIQAHLSTIGLMLLEHIKNLQQLHITLKKKLLFEVSAVNKLNKESDTSTLYQETKHLYVTALSHTEHSEKYETLLQASQKAQELLSYCADSLAKAVTIPHTNQTIDSSELREFAAQVILETAKYAPLEEGVALLEQCQQTLVKLIPAPTVSTPAIRREVLKALIRKYTHIVGSSDVSQISTSNSPHYQPTDKASRLPLGKKKPRSRSLPGSTVSSPEVQKGTRQSYDPHLLVQQVEEEN